MLPNKVILTFICTLIAVVETISRKNGNFKILFDGLGKNTYGITNF
ncbi:MAG: hypothetical protein JWQ96_3083 [Segetibacter sp.]|nr:hypothetical protein [Segetibacter sp.]